MGEQVSEFACSQGGCGGGETKGADKGEKEREREERMKINGRQVQESCTYSYTTCSGAE